METDGGKRRTETKVKTMRRRGQEWAYLLKQHLATIFVRFLTVKWKAASRQ